VTRLDCAFFVSARPDQSVDRRTVRTWMDRYLLGLQRARRTNPLEWAHLLRRAAGTGLERVRRSWSDPTPCGQSLRDKLVGRLPEDVIGAIPDGVPWVDRRDMARLYRSLLPGRAAAARHELSDFRAGRYVLFGRPQQMARPVDYLRDWISGYAWPLAHWSRISYRWPPAGSDVRRVWELNRLSHLTAAAGAAVGLDDSAGVEAVVDELADWLTANPALLGPSWVSSLEIGLRLLSLGWLRVLVGDRIAARDGLAASLLGSVWVHGRQLVRRPSRHSSANNHSIGEALGAYAAGVLFSEFSDSYGWRAWGAATLEREALRQVFPSGASFEQSTAYTRLVLECCAVYIVFARWVHDEVADELLDRVRTGFDLLALLLPDHGEIPLLGDNDDAVTLAFGDTRTSPTRALLALGSVVFDEQRDARSEDERRFWLTGNRTPDGARSSAPAQCVAPEPCVTEGFAVWRTRIGQRFVLATLRAGAFGAPPIYAHAHDDLLGLTLAIDGVHFVVDPGTYGYGGDPERRAALRSAGAHSVLLLPARGMANPCDPFMWSRPPKSEWVEVGPNSLAATLYLRSAGRSLVQTRTVERIDDPPSLIVSDSVEGAGTYDAILRWVLDGRWQVSASDREQTLIAEHEGGSPVQIRFLGEGKPSVKAAEGASADPWWSPHYGERVPCRVVELVVRIDAATPCRTVFDLSGRREP
jgi:Heparinase II/III-like protein/Heparinase II/III N-terminus